MTIQTYLTNLCQHSGVDAEQVVVTLEEDDTHLHVQLDVPAEDSGLFIGYHGETLSSLQRLVRVIFQEKYADKKITVNVNDYREQRTSKLEDMARNAAERVLSSGQSYRFSYLPPHERFVIHSFISENPDYSEVESVSEGEGGQRFLTIRLKAAA
jgi:spoIIIJ-associated protein